MPIRPAALLAGLLLLVATATPALAASGDLPLAVPQFGFDSREPDGEWMVVAAFRLQADSVGQEAFLLDEVVFEDQGTGDWTTVIEAALAVDMDGDNRWDPTVDMLNPVVPPAPYTGYNYTSPSVRSKGHPSDREFSFFASAQPVLWVNDPRTQFLLYRIAAGTGVTDHRMFQPQLEPVWAKGCHMHPVIDGVVQSEHAVFRLIGGNFRGLTLAPWPGGLAPAIHPAPPAPTIAPPGGVVMAARLRNPSSIPTTINGLTLELAAGDPVHLTSIKLVHDANANGQADDSEDVLGTFPYGFITEQLAVDLPGFVLTAGNQLDLVAVASLSDSPPHGMAYTVSIANVQSDPDYPCTHRDTVIVDALGESRLTVHVDTLVPVAPIGEASPLARLRIDGAAASARAVVDTLRLTFAGEGSDALHSSLSLARPGPAGQTGTTIATARRTRTGDVAFHGLGLEVSAGTRLELLLVGELADNAAAIGGTLTVCLTAVVTQSAATVEGLPAESGPIAVGDELVADDDAEYDPIRVPAPIGSAVGCSVAGAGTNGSLPAALFALLTAGGLRRRRG